ncbi:Transmembrane 9 superfamily member 1, partial [Stylophora pistillata]
VPLYVNKVGPYFNPQETYHYYSLPVCRPEKVEHRSLTLGEVLDGDRMAVALHEVNFKEQKENVKLCTVTLKEKQVQVLREAIEDLYYFEFVLANVSTANHQPVALDDIELPYNMEFTYSVMWSSTDTPYSERLKIKGAGSFFPKSLEVRLEITKSSS